MQHYQASSLQLNRTFPPSSTFGGFTDEDLISNAELRSKSKADDIKMTNVHILHRLRCNAY